MTNNFHVNTVFTFSYSCLCLYTFWGHVIFCSPQRWKTKTGVQITDGFFLSVFLSFNTVSRNRTGSLWVLPHVGFQCWSLSSFLPGCTEQRVTLSQVGNVQAVVVSRPFAQQHLGRHELSVKPWAVLLYQPQCFVLAVCAGRNQILWDKLIFTQGW